MATKRDGVPIKSEADFLAMALHAVACDISAAVTRFNNNLGMIEPERGKGLVGCYGQSVELSMLLNHATSRALDLLETVNDNPDSIPSRERRARVRVTKAPPIEDQLDPATVFGGEKARRAAQRRVNERKAKHRASKA